MLSFVGKFRRDGTGKAWTDSMGWMLPWLATWECRSGVEQEEEEKGRKCVFESLSYPFFSFLFLILRLFGLCDDTRGLGIYWLEDSSWKERN